MSGQINNAVFTDLDSKQTDYYNIADATWKSFQKDVITWITNNDGVASNSLDDTSIEVDIEKTTRLLSIVLPITEIFCD